MCHKVKPGDLVLWKRDGTIGHYLARVVRVRCQGPRPIRIQILDHEWWPGSTLKDQCRSVRVGSIKPIQQI
jgi:hypothetical protein